MGRVDDIFFRLRARPHVGPHALSAGPPAADRSRRQRRRVAGISPLSGVRLAMAARAQPDLRRGHRGGRILRRCGPDHHHRQRPQRSDGGAAFRRRFHADVLHRAAAGRAGASCGLAAAARALRHRAGDAAGYRRELFRRCVVVELSAEDHPEERGRAHGAQAAAILAGGESRTAGLESGDAGVDLRRTRRRSCVARLFSRTRPLAGRTPRRRDGGIAGAEAAFGPAPGRAAGAGRTAFPVQHTGVSARAGAPGAGAGRGHAGCAGGLSARHHPASARRGNGAAFDARAAARSVRELSRTDASAYQRAAELRDRGRCRAACAAVPADAAHQSGRERDQTRHRAQARAGQGDDHGRTR